MRAASLCLLAFVTACGLHDVKAVDKGKELFSESSLSTSPFNAFSCATCHAVGSAAPSLPAPNSGPHAGAILPGYGLYDVVHRPSFWGGYETRLLDSINYCFVEFMGGGAMDASDKRARALYEYLASVSPDATADALPLTVVKDITNYSEASGDATRGKDVYTRACKQCHGEPHSGNGKLGSRTSTIPEDTLKVFPTNARTVVVEKVRHGKFFNIGGNMPLYSEESLSDAEIADIVAYLGL